MVHRIYHDDGRFYMKTANGEPELLYKINGSIMSVYHTFVPEMERHNRIAAELVEAAFSFAIKNKLKVKPDCPYVSYYLDAHKELRKYSI